MEINFSTEGLSNLNIFKYYWIFALAAAISFYKFTCKFGDHLNPELKQELSKWLNGEYESTWSIQFCRLFDSVFGDKHLSLKRLIRSILASALSVALLYFIFRYIFGILGTRTQGSIDVVKALLLGMLINLLPDYLSLIETRWLLERFSKTRSLIIQALLLLIDLLFTASIILFGIYLYSYIFTGEMPSPILIIALFSIYSIFFYSTFISSIWAWIYCLTTWFIRLFSRLGLRKVLNVDNEPIKQIALIGAVFIFIGVLVFSPVFKSSKQGEASAFDNFLCKIDLKTCFHLAQSNDNQALTVHFMELACQNKDNEGNCENSLEKQFEESPTKIIKIMEHACENGFSQSCSSLAFYYRDGDKVKQDYDKAKTLYQKACDENNMRGCSGLGYMYYIGNGVDQDYKKAKTLYQKACEGQSLWGCNNLGVLYDLGNGVDQDYKKAKTLYQKACEGDYMWGCANLGHIYNKANGVDQDYEKAATLYQTACEGEEMWGCANLGYMYENGDGIEQNYEKAIALYRQACEGGISTACQ